MMKRVLYIATGLALVFALAACGTAATGATGATAGKTTTTAVNSAETTAAPGTSTTAKASDTGTRENPVPFGAEAKAGDWTVKIMDYNPDATKTILAANPFNEQPAAGEQYVLVSLAATYNGDKSGTFWMDTSGSFLGNAGNTFDSGMVVAPKPITDAGEAFPGASIAGDLVFAVPTAQLAGGLLMLENTFSFDDPVFFALH